MKLSIAIALSSLHVASSAESASAPTTNPQDCINPADYPADTDFFPEKFVPHTTTDLVDVTYHNTYKIVHNKFNEKTYLFYQCGTEPPADEVASGKHHMVVPVPHKEGVVLTQTPQIPPMELLGLRTDVKAYVGNPKLVSSPCLNHMMDEESMQTIYNPEDPYNSTWNDIAADEFLEENPNAIIFSGPTSDSDANRRMAIAASQERTAVATFDWLGMYAALFNLEGEANKIIADTESRYQCSADNAAVLTADIEETSKPRVLWAQLFSGIGWSVASCPEVDSAYYCEFAHHCGASIVSRPEGMGFSKQYGSPTIYWYLNDEDFLALGKDVDSWVYPASTFEDVYNEKKEMLDQFKSVQNKKVYDTQGQGPYGWHEQRLAEYDVVALDMCSLLGTSNPDTIHQNRWFRNYFTDGVGNAGTCDAPTEIEMAYVPAQSECSPMVLTESEENAGSRQDVGLVLAAAVGIVAMLA